MQMMQLKRKILKFQIDHNNLKHEHELIKHEKEIAKNEYKSNKS